MEEKQNFERDYSEAWQQAFQDSADEAGDRRKKLREQEAKERRNRAELRRVNHHRRKWDAVGKVLLTVLVTAAVYGFAAIGMCPASVAACIMVLLSGYMVQMGKVVIREVIWYGRHVARKRVRA